MTKNHSLILTNNYEKVNSKENLLVLFLKKPFCKIDLTYETVNFPEISKKEVYERYNFCELLYDSLFPELVVKLNSIHGVSLSLKSWGIIIGRWLKEFIQVNYKTFLYLDYTYKNYNINRVYTLDQNKYKFHVNDTVSMEHAPEDEEWFFLLCSKITNHFYKNKVTISNVAKSHSFKILKKENGKKFFFKKTIFNFFLHFIKFLKNCARLDDYGVIYNSYLSFWYEKLLELKLKQIPLLWPKIEINYSKRNEELRSKINFKLDEKNTSFENYLKFNLPDFLPTFVLEDFKNIKEIAESKIYPKNPKFIFTSGSYAYDEVFKLYVAIHVNKQVPYYIGQHGNNYFTQIHHSYLSELKYCDRFISWGVVKNNHTISAFNFKSMGKNYIFKPKGKLIIFLAPSNNKHSEIHKNEENELNNVRSIVKIIKLLKPDIKKNTILRFHDYTYKTLGTKYTNFFKDLGVEFDDGSRNAQYLLKESRLTFFTYDSTGILENFILNVPTMFFNEKNFVQSINDEYCDKYEVLLKNKIMFTKEESAAEHINMNWNNIGNWWQSEKIQKIIDEFNFGFNNKPDKQSLNNLKKILSKKP